MEEEQAVVGQVGRGGESGVGRRGGEGGNGGGGEIRTALPWNSITRKNAPIGRLGMIIRKWNIGWWRWWLWWWILIVAVISVFYRELCSSL